MGKRSEKQVHTAPSETVEIAAEGIGTSEARHRICLAAFQLFGTRGYSCTSIQDIADAASVKKSILYYYFASKEDLYQSLLVESATHLRGLLLQGLRGAGLSVETVTQQGMSDGGAETTLSTLAETILSLARENRESVRFFLSHIFAVDSDRPPCSAVPIEQVPQTLILGAIQAGIASGEIAGDPRLLESLILGGIQVSIIRHLRSPEQQPLPTGYGRSLVQAALDGFRPAATPVAARASRQSISDGGGRPKKRLSRA